MTLPTPQVTAAHYTKRRYNHRVRWMNFWHQIDEVLSLQPERILEVGKGSGLVSEHLKKMGHDVTTVDIDESVHPDVRASVTDLPFERDAFDVVLCAEVLEHLPFDTVPRALSEIERVARRGAVISLPYAGSRLSCMLKIPKLPLLRFFIPIPYFWKTHKQTREHYWEVGKKGFSRARIRSVIQRAGWQIRKERVFHDDFNHLFFVLKQQ